SFHDEVGNDRVAASVLMKPAATERGRGFNLHDSVGERIADAAAVAVGMAEIHGISGVGSATLHYKGVHSLKPVHRRREMSGASTAIQNVIAVDNHVPIHRSPVLVKAGVI